MADDDLEKVRALLDEHYEKYINFPPGPGCNLRLLMLCEDTIAGIKALVDTKEVAAR